MTDNEIFEAVKQRFTDPKVMDLLRNGLADPEEMEVVKRALRYGDAAMTIPSLRSILYKVFDRLLNVVKDDSTTRQMVKQDLRQLQKGDSDMSEDLNTANVTKAVAHDCAKHVVHEQWGKGQCIAGEHTLLDDGTVTHYDVMFEHGIEQDVPVADLQVVVSESHMHASKKRKPAMEEEAVAPEGGEDSSKASKKGKPEMPLEKLKAIMEKKKSEAYKAMLRSQGKMEEEVEKVDEAAKTGSVRYSDDGDITHRVLHSSGQNHLTMTHHNEHPGNIKFHGKMDGHAIKFTANPKNKDDFDPSSSDIKRHLKQAHPGLPPEVHAKVLKHATSGLKHLSLDLGEETEIEEKTLTKAEMKKREEVAKAIKRDQPGMPMGKKMAIATATAKKVAEELVGNQHRIDANKNGKIDAHDFKLLKAKKKTMKEFVEQLAESLVTESEDKHEEVGMHNGDVFKPPNHGGYKSTQDNPKAHENVEKAHYEMVDHIARHLPHMDPKARKETVKDVGSVSKKFHSAMEVDPDSQTDSEAEKIEDHHAEMRKETNHAQKSSGLHSSKTLHGQHGNNPEFKKHHEALKRTLENGDHKSAEETIAAMKGMKGK